MNIKPRFQSDIEQHQMTILRDDGVYRHVRFARPQSSAMHFNLVTWPGYLAYTGDMGAYVFTRVQDMFDFFRRPDKSYRIDMNYWAEKVGAADKQSGVRKFSPVKFQQRVTEWVNRDEADANPGLAEPEALALHNAAYGELRAAVEEEVLNCDDDSVRAYDAVSNFKHSGEAWQRAYGSDATYEFGDFLEVDVEEYTFRFAWCCEALAWAVAQYDAAKEAQAPALAEAGQ